MESFEAVRAYEPIFNSWKIKKRIGSGSYGEVYLAENVSDVRTNCAIKFIRIPKSREELRAKMDNGMTREDATSYFKSLADDMLEEIKIMSQLKGCANIVSLENYGNYSHADGKGWDILIQMELLTPLLTYLKKTPPTERSVIELGIDICKALIFCEKNNIIHRDIKPGNILVSANGDYKLGDFGIARTMDQTVSMMSSKGTKPYMAPEVFRGEEYGKTVDVYSLGIVMYQLLNGRTPFLPIQGGFTTKDELLAETRRFRGDPLPAPVNGSPELKQIILKACAPNAADRYSSAAQMRDELQALLFSGRPFAPLPPIITPTEEPSDDGGTDVLPGDWSGAADEPGTDVLPGDWSGAADEPGTDVLLPGDWSKAAGGTGTDVPEESTPPEKKKRWLPIAIAAAVVVIGTISVLLFGGKLKTGGRGSEGSGSGSTDVTVTQPPSVRETPKTPHLTEAPSKPGETPAPDDPIESPEATETPFSPEYSEWSDTLPEAVQGEAYAIRSREVFRSTEILKQESRPNGNNYRILSENKIPTSGWIGPQTEPVTATATRNVKTDTTPDTWADAGTGTVRSRGEVPQGSATERYIVTSENPGYWGAWSAEQKGDYLPAETAAMQVKLVTSLTTNGKTTYIYKTCPWIDGSVTYTKQVLVKGVTQYYYQTCKYEYTYYDDSKWTEQEFITQSNQLIIKMRMQYSYAPVNADWPASPDMEHFLTSDRDYTRHYKDMTDSAKYSPETFRYLRTADELAILCPDQDLNFRPNDGVTVGELIRAAVIVNRTYQGYTGLLCAMDGDSRIYMDYAAAHGLIEKDEYADPEKTATRKEMLSILSRALPKECLEPIDPNASVSDMDSGSEDYERALPLVRAGVFSVGTDGKLRPDEKVTRVMAAELIEKLVHPSSRKGA